MARNAGATASKSHRFLAKVPSPRHRVPSVPAFPKMRVQAATRTFTDVGGSRGAEGKPSRSRPAGVEAGGSIGGLDHGCSRRLIGQIATHLSCEPADRFLPEWQTPKERRKSPAEQERFANPWSPHERDTIF